TPSHSSFVFAGALLPQPRPRRPRSLCRTKLQCGTSPPRHARARPPLALGPVRLRPRRHPLRLPPLVRREELPPARLPLPGLERAPVLQRPAVVVVVGLAPGDEELHQRGVKEQLLEPLHRPEPHQVADDAGAVVADLEPPALAPDRVGIVADDLDVTRI